MDDNCGFKQVKLVDDAIVTHAIAKSVPFRLIFIGRFAGNLSKPFDCCKNLA